MIGLFLLGSFFTNTVLESAGGNDGNGQEFEAVMVNTEQIANQYNQPEKNNKSNLPPKKVNEQAKPKEEVKPKEEKTSSDIAEQPTQEKQLINAKEKQKVKELHQQTEAHKQEILKQEQLKKAQAIEATRKKQAEMARLKADAEAKNLQAMAKAAQEDKAQKKLEAQNKAKLQAEQKMKEKAEKEAKLKAEKEAKKKADVEAKLKAEQDAKQKADAEKARNDKALNDFMNGRDVGNSQSHSDGLQGNGNSKSVGEGKNIADVGYAQLIKKKLARTYRVDPSFSGRECQVKIFIDSNGYIVNHQVLSGPEDICRAAVSAITSAKNVPRAPNEEIYNKYKSPIIKFGLKIL
ncbi:cell envelope integrity protein TolA [[Haemophilus] ducreyi]|uniref:Cell envelope biogenesis protein TolA n=1 Tax=Haemophilus ducreyi TaxID=730 RepID=A0AAC8UDR7_HAEDC|nr:cell envelope integrity protein TolA [[Haemophilus] ducreyi]AKO31636.1 cell envelope biogenesis protein TolA [[Haemophilus] ducreyi]AKO33093.1 cell envelope biogenesis protein TolA [[Haemophilus] ducreyi]AKO34541.1 cell envelope biogenesis protein TolA [[Haemophilus] ducreyi]AKO35976.1 cell envelope biogenesis protein TolA [[Haemophilus] ducreyi]AKO40475.1 cell envelope biogenesis protein TolA [[Haemophilus] ducreyi]